MTRISAHDRSLAACLSRRTMLQATAGLGASTLALQTLLAADATQSPTQGVPHHPATARSVIFLFMAGGPSQVDTFDPKPLLAELAGQDVPESIARHVPKIKRAGLHNLMASPWEFQPRGECGMPISTLLPHTAQLADDLCIFRSMTHRNPVHGPGECVALTGSANGQRPSLGAWSIYGLGSESHDLPAFIAMNLHNDGMQNPQAAGWNSGFLPSCFQGTVVRPDEGIRDVSMPAGVTTAQRQRELAVLRSLNQQFLDSVEQHSELDARIRSYETAFHLQTSGPELFNISSETTATQQLYGLNDTEQRMVGLGCLLGRRMVERGVRFVQIRVSGWDAHSNIQSNHERQARRTDGPIAALLTDLKRRGLLDSTLVVWGGEFGRTPTMEGRGKGRDHSPAAYTVWLAGGGIQGGQIIGHTDDLGYTVTDHPIGPLDLHATILHALGLNSN
ncbi:MAG: DUF1501 domain-containing protein, partial [Planctomycetaceae bacterium]|nr:DUF1501 domain-containing protein [Planctomycetaceae bacterium]